MPELDRLCEQLGIDSDRARAALAQARGTASAGPATPWYVRVVVGAGAWVTVIAAAALGGAMLSLTDLDDSGTGWLVLGIVYLVIGLVLLRAARHVLFVDQLGGAIATAGVAMAAVGAGIEAESAWPAFVVSAAATAVIVMVVASPMLEFLAALIAASAFVVAVLDPIGAGPTPYYRDVVALTGIAGIYLMLLPPRRDLKPVATVLLLVFPIVDWVDLGAWPGAADVPAGGLAAKAIQTVLLLTLGAIHWRRGGTVKARPELVVLAAAAVAVVALLPAGGAAALTILTLAFIVGSRPLALVGALIEINYLWRYYYDLETTLLVKSGILCAVGAVLCLARWIVTRRSAAQSPS